MKLFAEISKVEERDDGTLFVSGIASTEDKDTQGEIVTADAMKAAMPEFFRYGTGNLREMHQPQAAGVVEKAYVEDNKTFIECLVVDPVAVKKVQMGVYKGFSIGGKSTQKADGVISGLRLTEISLVDRPANPECTIQLWKGEDMEPQPQKTAQESAVDELADLLNKGEIDVSKLLAFAKGEVIEDKPVESEVKKGLYGVQQFASILQSIGYIASDAQYESSYEGDDSPIPQQLRDWLKAGADIFTAMATEEINELQETLAAAVPASTEPVVISMSAATIDINKGDEIVSKENANVSKSDSEDDKILEAFTASATLEDAQPDAETLHAGLAAASNDEGRALLAEAVAALGDETEKGDFEGHPFRGNQHTSGVSSGAVHASQRAHGNGTKTNHSKAASAHRAAARKTTGKTKEYHQKMAAFHQSTADSASKAEIIGAVESTIAKAVDSAVEKAVKPIADENAVLKATIADLTKRIDSVPAPAKGVLRVVEKGQDIGGIVSGSANVDIEVRKSDGSIDHEATAIAKVKQIHANGSAFAGR